MDWLAGSRQHMLELIVTRVLVLAPVFVLGFSEGVVNAYIIIVGFQAVFNHANVHFSWGPLRYLIVTPDFHHWHHSADDAAIDRNYAAHYAFLDHLFGSAVQTPANKPFPAKYGVVGDYMPDGFIKQQLFPFRATQMAQGQD
jgi:sterol desaturase/sphingolipid hydroxylase (fatty acid hydroxylase superfamily)